MEKVDFFLFKETFFHNKALLWKKNQFFLNLKALFVYWFLFFSTLLLNLHLLVVLF